MAVHRYNSISGVSCRPDGAWVQYSKYAAIEKQLAEALARIEQLESGLKETTTTSRKDRYSHPGKTP